MKDITKKIHRQIYIDFIHVIDEELATKHIDFDMFWELDNLFFKNVVFNKNHCFQMINFQMKKEISNGEYNR